MTSELAARGTKFYKKLDDPDIILAEDNIYKSTKKVIDLLNRDSKSSFISPLFLESENEESMQNDVIRFYYASTTLGRESIDIKVSEQDLMILYLNMIKRIGEKSAYGVVLESDFSINDDILIRDKFLVKVPINNGDPRNNKDMEIEFNIGMRGVNIVRKLIPNFMFTYSMFDCGTPHLSKTGEVVSFCTDKTMTKYVVIERINNLINTNKYFRQCTRQQMITLLLQVALSLKMAEEMIGFTHNDLHSGNVLIKDMGENVNVTYSCNGRNYEVASRYQPVIIDYGRASINTSHGKLAAATSLNLSSLYPEPHAIGDFFRFMVFAYDYSVGMNDLFEALYRIFTPKGTLKHNIRRHHECYDIIPPGKYTLKSVIKYLISKKDSIQEESVNYEVFDRRVMINHLENIIPIQTVENVIQYYELMESSKNEVDLTDSEVTAIANNAVNVITQYIDFITGLIDENTEYLKEKIQYYTRIIKAYTNLYTYFHKNITQKDLIMEQTYQMKSLNERVDMLM